MYMTLKDSGKREEFETGAVRDTNTDKPRYDLICPHALTRLANQMMEGAKKYGERNWEKGIPTDRCYESAYRHQMAWRMGDRSEDHAAAVLFNWMVIIHNEETSPLINIENNG